MSTRELDEFVLRAMTPYQRRFVGMVAARLDAIEAGDAERHDGFLREVVRLDRGLADLERVGGEVTSVDPNTRRATIVLRCSGAWDLQRFRKNPAVVFAASDVDLPIAKAEEIGEPEAGGQLRMRLLFTRSHALADTAFHSMVEGTLRCVTGLVERRASGATSLVAVSMQPLLGDDDTGNETPNDEDDTMTKKNDAKTDEERLDVLENEIVEAQMKKQQRITEAWRNPARAAGGTTRTDGTDAVVDAQERLQAARANAWRGGGQGGDAA